MAVWCLFATKRSKYPGGGENEIAKIAEIAKTGD
jgi:hypothetical protein